MTDRPVYFEHIRRKAEQRWVQLEQDPELAGPWHQLFKQVQSPRHVVSELLQNADDADATEASVEIINNEFVFSHNGHDFIEEHFESLCRFGYSNKRALHTIGFRGVGFKSTFSLGDEVRLITPTLSVAFYRNRFTEPVWIDLNGDMPSRTEVRVPIKDEYRRRELEKNLDEWLKSPASLLFFRSIRSLSIRQEEVRWISKGPGPVKNSEWMALTTDPEKKYLLLWSEDEDFPKDALDEIRQERMLAFEEELSFPPCRVEIVLGMEGRLFVILPTGVKTTLPFSCNAPFVQDPARLKIKDPEISPTNQWLLKRVGELAAKGMLEWLCREDLEIDDRSKAYALLPDVDRDDNSLEGCCATIVEEAFEETIENEQFLLTEDGKLVAREECISVPSEILGIWTPDQVTKLFDKNNRPILHRNISSADREKLINRSCFEELDKTDILNVLESKHLPGPGTWRQLLALWVYVSGDVTGHHYYYNHRGVRIVPVQGKDVLYAAGDVVRLGEKKLLQSHDDWEFLSEHLLVVNPNWLRFLAKQRRKAEQRNDDVLGEQVETASAVLKTLGLDDSSDVSRVIEQVAEDVFSQGECPLEDCVRLARIAAKLGASARNSFQFVIRNGDRKSIDQHIIADVNGDLDRFVTDEWYEEHVLHDEYWRKFTSCTESEWRQWITSGRSGLLTFVPLIPVQHHVWSRDELRKSLRGRGFNDEPYYPYVTSEFIFDDWDFDEEHWDYWKSLSGEDAEFWGHLFARVLDQPKGYWSKAISAKALQVATTGTKRTITHEDLLPSWIVKFRSLPCLRDARGHYRQPAELLRRTPETESLLDVEPFVRAEDDNEHTRPLLIKLGVRDTPTGPDRLLDRLRDLATVANPPVYEVEKWYHRLDQMLVKCSTDEYQQIRDAFANNKIILTENFGWARTAEVFLDADEDDVPEAAVVHASVRHLTLWRKIGVADRPTAELALEWLQSLPSGQKLSQDELRRVRSLLPRYAERIWHECGHWLNLEGEWTAVDQLVYSLTMQSLVQWKHLFKSVKQKTADFQKLNSEICQKPPFSELKSLSDSIEDRFHESPRALPSACKKRWLIALGNGLRRITLDDPEETERVRKLANRLVSTRWQVASGLKASPYIDGTPAGTPRDIVVLWKDSLLYVEDRSAARMAKDVAQELGRIFNRQEIADAIKICYDRSPEFITEYLEENFNLLPEEELIPTGTEKKTGHEKIVEPANGKDVTKADPAVKALSGDEDDGKEPTDHGDSDESDIQDTGISGKDEKADGNKLSHKPSIPKPGLMERFAIARGYKKDGPDRFYHPDGSCIEKTSGNSFPWERYSASGELQRCYWVKDHCIERGPLQVEAEVWELCDKHPDKYSLLLTDPDGNPVELPGRLLRELRDSGRLTLYPAKYRLVYDQEAGTQ
jgi:hypothetical protein